MKIIGYAFDGAAYCPEHVPQATADNGCENPKDHADEYGACSENCHGYGPNPIFSTDEFEGSCDVCFEEI